jgi:hypothetical protein
MMAGSQTRVNSTSGPCAANKGEFRLPATPNRSFKTYCFIEENNVSCNITVL